MSISTYSELQTAVANWLKRSDLTANIPDFIRLAEVRIKSLLDLKDLEVTADLTVTQNSDTVALPADFKSPVALWLDDINPREKLTQALPQTLPYTTTPCRPLYWAIDAGNVRFQAPALLTYPLKFRYLQTFELSNTNPTNDLLANYPDAYLFGALYEAGDYTHDDQNTVKWDAKFRDAIARALNQEASNQKYAPLTTELGHMGRRRFNIYRGY